MNITARIAMVAYAVSIACLLGHAAPAQAAQSELIQMLTKSLGVTPQQASGGAGALFNMAKSKLKPEDFSKVAAAVPGMDDLLKAAPKGDSMTSPLGSIPGAGGMSAVLDAFQSLGLTPDMVGKFVPTITKFVESKAGSGVASLLAGALK